MTEAPSHEPLSFQDALRLISEPDGPPVVGLVSRLSSPTSDEQAEFKDFLARVTPDTRRWLANEMRTRSETDIHVDFRSLFVLLLDDDDPDVRAASIDGLWEARDPHLADRFTRVLQTDDDSTVRARAAASLGSFVEMGQLGKLEHATSRATVEALIEAARDEGEDVEVRRRATESAGYADYTESGACIEEAFESTDRVLRAGAIRAMGNSADNRWTQTVLDMLDDPDAEIRFEAAHASGELTLPDAVSRLIWLAAGTDREIQLEAVWALGEIGGNEARNALEGLLASSDNEQLDEALEDALATVALWDGDLFWGAVPDGD